LKHHKHLQNKTKNVKVEETIFLKIILITDYFIVYDKLYSYLIVIESHSFS